MSQTFKIAKVTGALFALLLLIFCAYWSIHLFTGLPFNFHTVDEGKLYRSAQPTGAEIEEVVRRYGIKTVINLQGGLPGQSWYDEEKAATDKLGIRFINYGWSSDSIQDRKNWSDWFYALETAERPILVHCKSGADRTGEASAVYAMEVMGQDKEQALKQLTIWYHHFNFFKPSKRLFIDLYQGKEWVLNTYNPCLPHLRRFAGDQCLRAAPEPQ